MSFPHVSLRASMAADFPAFLRLAGRRVLVVGGGVVALRKCLRLLCSGARIELVAPTLHPRLAVLVASGKLHHLGSGFHAALLDGCVYAVAATDDEALNAQVAAAAGVRGVFVNVVDDMQLSTAISPAVVDRSPLTVAISSGGHAPVLVRRLRERFEAELPANLGALARFVGGARAMVKARLPLMARRGLWERFLAGPGAEAVLRGDMARGTRVLATLLNGDPPDGEVYLVGAGPGDPELLTLRALRLMQQADVVLYDRLVDPRILELVRRDAERVYVGKRSHHHGLPQREINAELVRRAQRGQRVVRLKGGDPFVFGRGGEEAEALAAHGVPFQIVPGVSAANGCAAYAGIPLTHRDCAQACVFVTGHARADGQLALPWDSLARRGQTVVIYMGLETLAPLCRQLIGAGLPVQWPAAVVENGTRPDQRVIASTLGQLPQVVDAAKVTGPSVVIVGEVVALRARLRMGATAASVHNEPQSCDVAVA
ncbi:MAG TPA: siroheme synthase CysG [Nevskiaceae bacterium]|nr:siroheme synthase CysG [Nevskiaceae bacterium]